VANNFIDEITKLKKDALLLIFSEYCGNCEQALEILENMAKEDIYDVNFLKINGDRNALPENFQIA
jgi:thiol-disulfide isomerase/thioredoxin